MKRSTIVFILITFFVSVAVITQLGELKLIFKTFEKGVWYFLVLALAFQLLYFAAQSEVRRSLYRIQGIKEDFWTIFKLTFLAMFVGTVIPFHVGGMALFLTEAKVKHYSRSKVLIGSLAFFFFDYMGFIVMLALALFLLFRHGNLNSLEVLGSGVLLAVVLGVAAAIFYILREESRIKKSLNKISKLLPKKRRAKWLPDSEIEILAKEMIEARKYFGQKKRKLWQPALFAVFTQGFGVLVLASCFLAYDIPFSLIVLITTYAMAMLFVMVAITPYGVGSVELVMTATLGGFGIDLTQALLLTLTFRFFTFWVPFAVGYISSKKLDIIDKL